MPATQQLNSSSPSRQGTGSSQGSQSVVHYQSQTQITTQTINTITKALDENNFVTLRQIASINDDYKKLVESFTSKFVTNKRQGKVASSNQQGTTSTKTAASNMQSTSSADSNIHQKLSTQNVTPGTVVSQVSSHGPQQVRRCMSAHSPAAPVFKQMMTNQRSQVPPPMSPTYSEYSSDTSSSDEDMLGFEQVNPAMQGTLRHLPPQIENLQPQMQRLPTPVQKPLEQGLVMKQEDIGRVQTANSANVRSIVVAKKNQQQMYVAAGNMASQQTLSGGQVAFSTQVHPRPKQKQHLQLVSGQSQMVQMQSRMTTPQQVHVEQQKVNPHMQVTQQQVVQVQGQQSAPVLMRRVAASKKAAKGKKAAKTSLEATEQSRDHVMSNQTQIVTSQLTQSNTQQPTNHNGGMGIQIGSVESLQTKGYNTTAFQGRNIQGMQQSVTAGQMNQQQLVTGKGTLAIRVTEMTTEGVQQQVQMALGQNVRVQMSPQKMASTQVINSTGLRQTAPRPLMTSTNVPQQRVAVRTGNIQQRQMNPQTAMPQQIRSDQRTQATMYQQMQTTRPDNLQTTAHLVRQPYNMGSVPGQPMVRPRMTQHQQIRHQTPMNTMQPQVHTTSQHAQQQMVTEGTRITSPQNVILRQNNNQQMVMRQQMQQQVLVRSDGHQFVQMGNNPVHVQGPQQFRAQLTPQQQHQQHVQQQSTQGELMCHQFVNNTSCVQDTGVVGGNRQLHQGGQAPQSTAAGVQQLQHSQVSAVTQPEVSNQESSANSSNTPSKSQQELQPPSTPNVTPPPQPPKEPNIMPLSTSADTNMCSMGRAGSNENLVKGQEYLIQYSNGKKVIGIWDGRFFKVKSPQSQESVTDESSPAASQSPASQPPIAGPAGDPEAMAGGGNVDKKLKGNPVGVNTSGVSNGLKVGTPTSNGPRYSGPNLARRPLHENSPVDPSTSYEVKRPTKRPPRPREEGKFAVCMNCGGYSADYDNCDSCHKHIPENAKLFKPNASPVGSASKKMRSDADFPPASSGTPVEPGKSAKLLLVQTGGATGQETPVLDKKLFYGKTTTVSAAALVIAQAEANLAGINQKPPVSARGRGKGKGSRGRGKSKKSQQIETVTILSSDDDDDSLPGPPGLQPGAPVPFNTTVAAGIGADQQAVAQTLMAANQTAIAGQPQHSKAGFRYRMEDDSGKVVHPKKAEKLHKSQQQQQHQQQQQSSGLASQDLSTILVQLQSRSIRIGSYRGIPADHFKITVQGVQFTIAWGEDCLQIHIGSNEITKVVCHLGESMPCMFLDTTPTCAQRLRQALEMVPGKEPYYDPLSEDEVHKRITVIFENLGEMGIENYIRALFQVMQAGNPYFQKEGNLLEEIEYQQANEILIQSTPQAHLQLLTLGLGPGFPPDEEEDDEPVDRSRSPSPARIFSGQIIKLFVYPPPPATGGISVTNEDLFCLNDGEFLNDVILDFYLKYIYLTKLSEEMKQKTHIFSSFFYRRLTSKQAKRNEDCTSIQERRHARVKTWTRHIDLFQKDFVIVPINESAHWYLAIICFPGLDKPVFHMERSKSPLDPPTPKETSTSQASQKGDMLDNITEPQNTDQQTTGENMETDENSTSASEQGVPTKRIQKQYLQVEWDTRKKEQYGERAFDKDSMKGANPKCPQQLNFSDCGIYVLQYVESFFESPPQDYNIPVRGLQDWFSEDTALCKREELRQLIVALQKQLNPSLQYDPAIDGCMVGGLEDEEDLPDLMKENQTTIAAVPVSQVGPVQESNKAMTVGQSGQTGNTIVASVAQGEQVGETTEKMDTDTPVESASSTVVAEAAVLSTPVDGSRTLQVRAVKQIDRLTTKEGGDKSINQKVSVPVTSTDNSSHHQESRNAGAEQLQPHSDEVGESLAQDSSGLRQALSKQSEQQESISESQLTSVSTYSLPSGCGSIVGKQQVSQGNGTVEPSEASSMDDSDNVEESLNESHDAQPVDGNNDESEGNNTLLTEASS